MQAAAAGIEPAKERLTAARPYQHGNTAKTWDRQLACPVSSATTTGWKPMPRSQAGSLCHEESAQWELNPHFRHGKAVGCRYIMGADLGQMGLEGLEPSPTRLRAEYAAANTLIP